MYRIKTLNAISNVYRTQLHNNAYSVGADIVDPDAIIVRSADMHAYAPNAALACIARAGAGVNNIPVKDMARKGVVVFNTPGANANAVRELAIAALLLSSRNIEGGIEWVKTLKGKGDEIPKLVEQGKSMFIGPELRGKTLGVIGLGEVGALVANAGKALDMNVLGFDPYISVDHAWMLSRSIGRVASQEELLMRSDYVSIHIPLLDATKHSFNSKKIAGMKHGATLINLSRGELVVNADVLAAIRNGQLREYVTDFPSDDLINQPNVICIPHLGASTPESEDNCVVMASRQIDQYLRLGSIKNSVNYPDCELGEISGHRLAVLHANVPNVVSALTNILSQYGINIGSMMNKSRGEFAYTVLDLDDAFDRERDIEQQIRALDTVYGVRCW